MFMLCNHFIGIAWYETHFCICRDCMINLVILSREGVVQLTGKPVLASQGVGNSTLGGSLHRGNKFPYGTPSQTAHPVVGLCCSRCPHFCTSNKKCPAKNAPPSPLLYVSSIFGLQSVNQQDTQCPWQSVGFRVLHLYQSVTNMHMHDLRARIHTYIRVEYLQALSHRTHGVRSFTPVVPLVETKVQ